MHKGQIRGPRSDNCNRDVLLVLFPSTNYIETIRHGVAVEIFHRESPAYSFLIQSFDLLHQRVNFFRC